MIRAGLIQLCASDDPAANLPITLDYIRAAAAAGAQLVVTPEVTNCVSTNRAHQQAVLRHQDQDATLAAIRALARELSLWVVIGSLALKTEDADGRFANRSFVVGPDGQIAGHYDKIHMFDVEISAAESYRESAGYRPGARAVVVPTDLGVLGLTVCYDLRFGSLFRELARAGAQVITVPSAFSPVTGAAHWEVLLRARAIETGAFVLAPAQVGRHRARAGRPRETHGHSLAVAPWGEVLCDMGREVGFKLVELDLAKVDDARQALPTLRQNRVYDLP